MIIELMVYTIAVSLLVGLAALTIEGAMALARWPRRWVWAVAMVVSLAGAATMERRTHMPPVASGRAPAAVITIKETAVRGIPFPPLNIGTQVQRARGSAGLTVAAQLENYAKWSWIGASGFLLGVYFVGALHLVRSRRHWPRRSIGKYQVLVAQDIGPAVFGLLRPAIVVPSWLLNEAVATRDAALNHENQHITARDPALLLGALLLLALTPWNVPLWWQLRRLKLAIEVDCDARVLGAGVDRRLYADTLLRINQYGRRLPLGAVAIGGRASQIERRIRAMMAARPRHLRLWILGLVAASIPLLVVAAELNPPSSAPATRRVYLGIGLADLDVNAGAASVTSVRRGAIVTWVNPAGVADQAGLKRGDLILEFGDTPIINASILAAAVGRTAPDARVLLVVRRGSVNKKLLADFSTSPPPQSPSSQIGDASDWDSLRDANLPISQPQLRDELVRMAKLDEFQSLYHKESTRKQPVPPDTSVITAGVRMEPGAFDANARRLREIIARYGWPTVSMVGVRGSTAAAMIAGEARNDPAFQAKVLSLMEPLLQRDEVPTMYYAGLFDAVHTPQRFGSMMECVKGIFQPSKPIEDPAHLEERRAALGLPKFPKFCMSTVDTKGSG